MQPTAAAPAATGGASEPPMVGRGAAASGGDELRAEVARLRADVALLAERLDLHTQRHVDVVGPRLEEVRREVQAVGREAEGANQSLGWRLNHAESNQAELRHDLAELGGEVSRRAGAASASAAHASEQRLRLDLEELRGWTDARVEELGVKLDSRLAQAEASWEAACERIETTARAELEQNATEMLTSREKVVRRVNEQIEFQAASLKATESDIAKRFTEADDKVDLLEAAWRDALVNLRHVDLRAQETATTRLQTVVGSLGMGIVRLAQVMGVLPHGLGKCSAPAPAMHGDMPYSEAALTNASEILDWELCGNPISSRIDEAWRYASDGQRTYLDLIQVRSEQATRRTMKQEMVDLDAHVRRLWEDCFPKCDAAAASPPFPAPLASRAAAYSGTPPSVSADTPRGRREIGKSQLSSGGQRALYNNPPNALHSADLSDSPLAWTCATSKLPSRSAKGLRLGAE